jgi:sugar lactone lactonase YvrE
MPTLRATPACSQIHLLAEGPLWDPVRGRVLWVDVNQGRVHTGTLAGDLVVPQQTLTFEGTVGAVACSVAGDLLVAASRCLETVLVDGTRILGPELIAATTASRLNDGGCDPAGRFLVGSLALDDRTGQESLFRVDPAAGEDSRITTIDDDLTLSNGLAFSPDGSSFYSVDTIPSLIRIRDYDLATGTFGPRRDFLRISDGFPDGLCVDAAGNLWVAIWGAGQIRCFSPAGDLVSTVEVAAPNTSSVAFVGPDLDVLLITTASEQLSRAQRERFPDSGKLFSCRPGVTGAPVPAWSGRSAGTGSV